MVKHIKNRRQTLPVRQGFPAELGGDWRTVELYSADEWRDCIYRKIEDLRLFEEIPNQASNADKVWRDLWNRKSDSSLRPLQGEDVRYVRVADASKLYDPLDCPQFVKEFSELYEQDEEGVRAFYRRWGTLNLHAWHLRRRGRAAKQPWGAFGCEPVWLAKRESYRLRVLRSFDKGLKEAIGLGDNKPDDTLLKSLVFPGKARDLLGGRRSDDRDWVAPLIDDNAGVYKVKHLTLPYLSLSRLKNASLREDTPRETLVAAALVFLQNELASVLSVVSTCPYIVLADPSLLVAVRNQDGAWGTTRGAPVSKTQLPFAPGFQYHSLLDAAYLMLYDEVTGGRYESCPNCGSLYTRMDGKRGRRRVFCSESCESSYNNRQRYQRRKKANRKDLGSTN